MILNCTMQWCLYFRRTVHKKKNKYRSRSPKSLTLECSKKAEDCIYVCTPKRDHVRADNKIEYGLK
jgi:hypothetical protein